MNKHEQQYLKPTSIPSQATVSDKLQVKMRPDLPRRMCEIAEKHRDLAKQVTGRNPNKHMPEELKEAMISMLFAYTCLEAYINKIGHDELGIDWSNKKYRNHGILQKWKEVPKELVRKNTGIGRDIFDENKDPFKSFIELKNLREELIIHNKAQFYDVEKTKYGRMEKLVNSLSSKNAEMACNTMKAMMRKLHNEAGLPMPSWL